MSRRARNRYFGSDGGYGAPLEYFTSGPARGPREAFLPPQAAIHPKFHADRQSNHGLFFDDDDNPNEDDYMLYHTFQVAARPRAHARACACTTYARSVPAPVCMRHAARCPYVRCAYTYT